MIVRPVAGIVDASVGMKLVLNEPDSLKAQELFAHLADPAAQILVPDFFYLECANVLWKLVQRKTLTNVEALQNYGTIKQYSLRVVSMARSAIDEALQLALQFGSSAYDALYVAISVQSKLPLITADDKLVKKFAGSPCQVLFC